jgi:hypothetical protein
VSESSFGLCLALSLLNIDFFADNIMETAPERAYALKLFTDRDDRLEVAIELIHIGNELFHVLRLSLVGTHVIKITSATWETSTARLLSKAD